MERMACHGVKVFAQMRESGETVNGPAESYEVKSFSHGLTMKGDGDWGEIRTNFDATPVGELPDAGANAIRALPPEATWVNLRSLGAKGDGVTDDTAAIRRAIAEHAVLYVPEGRYVVSDTIELRPDTVLIGLASEHDAVRSAGWHGGISGTGHAAAAAGGAAGRPQHRERDRPVYERRSTAVRWPRCGWRARIR